MPAVVSNCADPPEGGRIRSRRRLPVDLGLARDLGYELDDLEGGPSRFIC